MTTNSLTDITYSPNTLWELTALSPVLGDLSIPVTPSLSIGRHTDNDVVLAVPQVSRRHAKFNQVGQHLYLQDLNSANGTFVNGQKIGNEAVAINPNDEIGFADLVFVLSLQNQTLSREALETVAEKMATSMPPSETLPIVPEQVVTKAVELPPQVDEPVAIPSTVTPTINNEPTVAPTMTASVTPPFSTPIEPQTISPISAKVSPELAHKNHASKNMWLIAIVIILLIAGLVIAKMVL